MVKMVRRLMRVVVVAASCHDVMGSASLWELEPRIEASPDIVHNGVVVANAPAA